MSGFLFRLGRGSAAHPWRTICAWIGVVVAVTALAIAPSGSTTHDDYHVPDSPAQAGVDLLRDHLPQAGYASAQVVVHDRSGSALAPPDADRSGRAARRRCRTPLRSARRASPPTATPPCSRCRYDVEVTDPDLMGNVEPLEAAIAPTQERRPPGRARRRASRHSAAARMEGHRRDDRHRRRPADPAADASAPSSPPACRSRSRSPASAVGSAGIALLGGDIDVSTSAPTVATMVGLGVGIDYALLLVTRHVEYLGRGIDRRGGRRAGGRHRRPLGGLRRGTVLVSPARTAAVRPAGYSSFGYATAHRGPRRAAAALTLLPALLRLGGRRLQPRRVRRGTRPARQPARSRLTARWAERVGRRPLAVGARRHRDCWSPSPLPAARHAHLAAGRQQPAAPTLDHAPGLRPDHRRVRRRRQRPAHARGRPRAVSDQPCRRWPPSSRARPDIASSSRSPSSPDGALAVVEARADVRPDRRAHPGPGRRRSAPSSLTAPSSPARRRCSPTSPTCWPTGCGSSSASWWGSRCCCWR